jgi:hypothetical protein
VAQRSGSRSSPSSPYSAAAQVLLADSEHAVPPLLLAVMGINAVLDNLAAKPRNDQERAVVERLIHAINIIQGNRGYVPVKLADAVRTDYTTLLESRFWDEDDLDAEVVRRYIRVRAPPKDQTEDRGAGFSLLLPPWNTGTGSALPMDLVDSLERTHFLHVLATRPQSILPPGKSLVSALASTRQDDTSQPEPDVPATLKNQVEKAVHRAFWDEVSPDVAWSELG